MAPLPVTQKEAGNFFILGGVRCTKIVFKKMAFNTNLK